VEWQELAQLVTSAGVANLATASRTGRPHASVVSPAIEGNVLWFGTWTTSGKAHNLRENPQVALMWRPQAEIYLRGTAELVTDADEKHRVWGAGLFSYDQEALFLSPDNPDLVYVRVRPLAATVLSAGPVGLTRKTWQADRP
jgi:general stress protein 26